ncbi:hypothetical protein ACHAW5_003126 [Stephanodiscus triporus]|uniref:SET domain-containing protein n=1 Tax=Stephanodiscus triporus TaxID=2934178 RepID=A0ABD3N3V4_9STRA
MSIDLGRENADPTLPATSFLQRYCAWKYYAGGRGGTAVVLPSGGGDDVADGRGDYLDMLPPYPSDDWGSDATAGAAAAAAAAAPTTAKRLLIPLIDMCNHDRDSPHVLSGRAVPGGMLRVVAGANVKAGDAVNIAYGAGVEGNDRFVQDYGFLDSGGSSERGVGSFGGIVVPEGYRILARRILGRRGLTSGSSRRMSAMESERALEALGRTTLEDDEALLASGTVTARDERMALEYRMGVKRALRLLQRDSSG